MAELLCRRCCSYGTHFVYSALTHSLLFYIDMCNSQERNALFFPSSFSIESKVERNHTTSVHMLFTVGVHLDSLKYSTLCALKVLRFVIFFSLSFSIVYLCTHLYIFNSFSLFTSNLLRFALFRHILVVPFFSLSLFTELFLCVSFCLVSRSTLLKCISINGLRLYVNSPTAVWKHYHRN